jgi:hypothetical protein
MSVTLRALLLAIPLLIAREAYADRRAEEKQLDAVATAYFDYNSMSTLEAPVIKGSSDRATRNGTQLTLKVPGGKPIVLASDTSGCSRSLFKDPNCFSFILVADLPSRYLYIVAFQHYDRRYFLLIDGKTGKQSTIYGAPRLNPDGQYVLEINNNSTVGTRLHVWRRIGGGICSEWEMQYGYDEIGSAEQIRFLGWEGDRIHLDLTDEIGGDWHRAAKLIHKGKDWVFEAADRPDR